MWDRDTKTLAGFCGAILAAIAVAVFLRDVIGHGDPALWANIVVAVGTLALAAATVWSVSRTNAIIEGEDRRHQQQFAPLVKFEFSVTGSKNGFQTSDDPFQGFVAVNIGNGLAVNVIIQFDAVLYYETSREIIQEVAVSIPVGTGEYVGEAKTVTINRTLLASAIEKDGKARFDEPLFREVTYGKPYMKFSKVRLIYEDMFGNRYTTLYDRPGSKPEVYDWIQPKSLRVS